jgi:exocyst complex component 8
MASIASDMFVGRERFSTLLMMRLTETVMLWLSEDQSFWEEIEDGPRALGPLGLQQVRSFNFLFFFHLQLRRFQCLPGLCVIINIPFYILYTTDGNSYFYLPLQFYLDMQFVILFGQGRFLSRHVHQVILNIIDRAMAAFSATGMDPDR